MPRPRDKACSFRCHPNISHKPFTGCRSSRKAAMITILSGWAHRLGTQNRATPGHVRHTVARAPEPMPTVAVSLGTHGHRSQPAPPPCARPCRCRPTPPRRCRMQPNERTYRRHFGRLRSPADTPRQTTGRVLSARAPPRALTSKPCTRSAKTGQPRAPSRHRHRGPSPTIHSHLRQPCACTELLSALDSRVGVEPLPG